ncbi:solute carrier family 35 member G1-like [Diadema antillarum]|uniref:solute carrier family 35 member G1-like n=1 Tax=Diadema antillarum TaxID=105358 RepID=UPI003A856FFD
MADNNCASAKRQSEQDDDSLREKIETGNGAESCDFSRNAFCCNDRGIRVHENEQMPSTSEKEVEAEKAVSRGAISNCWEVVLSWKGVWYTLTSAAIISLAAMSVRHLTVYISPNEVAFTRMMMQLVVCLPIAAWKQLSFNYTRQGYALLLLRSILGSLNTSLVFIAYTLMPVANAKAIMYSCPIFAGLLSWLLLKEACSFLDVVLGLVTLTGVMLVAQPPFLFDALDSVTSASSSSVLGAIICLISAFLSAIILILQRKLASMGISSLGMLTIYSLTATGFTALFTSFPNQWTLPKCGLDRFALIANGLINFFSQILIYLALKYERAPNVSLYHSSDVLFSFVLEFVFFGVVPNWVTLLGTVLIIASFVGIVGKQWFVTRKKTDEDDSEELSCQNDDGCSSIVSEDTGI